MMGRKLAETWARGGPINMMGKALLICAWMAVVGTACGGESASDDAVAVQVAAVAGQTIRGLSTASSVGTGAASAQDDEMEEPVAPPLTDVGCVTTRLEGAALVIDYGAGCTVFGQYISGAYVLRLLLDMQLGLAIEFREYEVDGLLHNGEVFASLGQNRLSAGVDLTLVEDESALTLQFDGTLWGRGQETFFDGAGLYDDGEQRAAFDATNLRIRFGACYPDDGVLVVELPDQPVVVLTFTMTTAETGEVLARINGRDLTIALPAYGPCPPAP